MPKLEQILLCFTPYRRYATAAGVPARIVSQDKAAKPAFDMNQYFIGIDDGMNLNTYKKGTP